MPFLNDSSGKYLGPRPTYRASGNIVAVAGTTPIIQIAGIANKVIRIQRIRLTGFNLTAVQYIRVVLSKLSALSSGGTSAVATNVPLDSGSPAGGAVVRSFTAAGSAGTSIGDIAEATVLGQATTPVAGGFLDQNDNIFDSNFGNNPPQLKTAAEGIAVRFAAAPASAVTFSWEIEWTEDGN